MSDSTPRAARILLLDDERLILATLGSGLRGAGFEVLTADSVDEAEGHLAAGACPDLAILDVNLPGRSGLQFAQRLRELDRVPRPAGDAPPPRGGAPSARDGRSRWPPRPPCC